jgi:hypothetical protein
MKPPPQHVIHCAKRDDMDIGFRFEVIYKAEDLIEVRISAWNGVFGGTADVYLEIGRLEEIAARLQGFPSHPSDTREVVLGAFGPEFAGGGVSMRFHCADRSGHAYVESRIESGEKRGRSTDSAFLTLHIEAAAVDSFVDELRRLGADRSGIARLEGTPVSIRR